MLTTYIVIIMGAIGIIACILGYMRTVAEEKEFKRKMIKRLMDS